MEHANPGLYRRVFAPRFVSALCGCGAIMEQRQRIVPRATGVVLEIGIGSGRNVPFYDPANVDRVIGVDPDAVMLKLGQGRFSGARVPLDVRQGTAEALPLQDHSVDTALVVYTLCSVDSPEAVLAELRRVVKPHGRVLFCEHGRADTRSTARWQNRVNPMWRRLAGGCNINRNVSQLLKDGGWSIEMMERFPLRGVPEIIGSHYVGEARLDEPRQRSESVCRPPRHCAALDGAR